MRILLWMILGLFSAILAEQDITQKSISSGAEEFNTISEPEDEIHGSSRTPSTPASLITSAAAAGGSDEVSSGGKMTLVEAQDRATPVLSFVEAREEIKDSEEAALAEALKENARKSRKEFWKGLAEFLRRKMEWMSMKPGGMSGEKKRTARSLSSLSKIVAPLFGFPDDDDMSNENSSDEEETTDPEGDEEPEEESVPKAFELGGVDGRRKLLVPFPMVVKDKDTNKDTVKYSIPFPALGQPEDLKAEDLLKSTLEMAAAKDVPPTSVETTSNEGEIEIVTMSKKDKREDQQRKRRKSKKSKRKKGKRKGKKSRKGKKKKKKSKAVVFKQVPRSEPNEEPVKEDFRTFDNSKSVKAKPAIKPKSISLSPSKPSANAPTLIKLKSGKFMMYKPEVYEESRKGAPINRGKQKPKIRDSEENVKVKKPKKMEQNSRKETLYKVVKGENTPLDEEEQKRRGKKKAKESKMEDDEEEKKPKKKAKKSDEPKQEEFEYYDDVEESPVKKSANEHGSGSVSEEQTPKKGSMEETVDSKIEKRESVDSHSNFGPRVKHFDGTISSKRKIAKNSRTISFYARTGGNPNDLSSGMTFRIPGGQRNLFKKSIQDGPMVIHGEDGSNRAPGGVIRGSFGQGSPMPGFSSFGGLMGNPGMKMMPTMPQMEIVSKPESISFISMDPPKSSHPPFLTDQGSMDLKIPNNAMDSNAGSSDPIKHTMHEQEDNSLYANSFSSGDKITNGVTVNEIGPSYQTDGKSQDKDQSTQYVYLNQGENGDIELVLEPVEDTAGVTTPRQITLDQEVSSEMKIFSSPENWRVGEPEQRGSLVKREKLADHSVNGHRGSPWGEQKFGKKTYQGEPNVHWAPSMKVSAVPAETGNMAGGAVRSPPSRARVPEGKKFKTGEDDIGGGMPNAEIFCSIVDSVHHFTCRPSM